MAACSSFAWDRKEGVRMEEGIGTNVVSLEGRRDSSSFTHRFTNFTKPVVIAFCTYLVLGTPSSDCLSTIFAIFNRLDPLLKSVLLGHFCRCQFNPLLRVFRVKSKNSKDSRDFTLKELSQRGVKDTIHVLV